MSDEMTRGDGAMGATLACADGVTPERLSAWRDGLLPADQAVWLATHTADCAACGERMRDYEQIGAALRGQIIPLSGADPWPAMRQRIARERRHLWLLQTPHWGGLGAVVAATLLIALFAGLLARQAALRPATSSTPTASAIATPTPERFGAWTQIASYQGLNGLAIAPSNPHVAYQFWQDNNATGGTTRTLRRTDDQGVTWRTLTLPSIPGATYPAGGGIVTGFVSPLDAQMVYLIIEAQVNTGCPANGVATGNDCQLEYYSADGGQQWRPLVLPAPGLLSGLLVGQGNRVGRVEGDIRAQGARLYGDVVNSMIAKDTLVTPGRLVVSDNGGATWRSIDGPIHAAGQGIYDYAPTPSGATIFVVSEPLAWSATPPALSIWRSEDAGATWTQWGQTNGANITGLRAVMDPSSGEAILYQQSVDGGGYGEIQGNPNRSSSGSWWQGAPSLDGSPTGAVGADMLATLPNGSLLIAYKGQLWTWKWAQIQSANLGWNDAGPFGQLDNISQVFTQTLPDGSLRLWVSVSSSGDASTVEYATLKP